MSPRMSLFRHPIVSRVAPPLTPPPITYDPDFYAKPADVRRQLFWIDPAGRTFPRFPAVPEVHKEVINKYATVHAIPKGRMLDFWMDYIDCLLSCHNFEEEAPAEFRAWAYGRLCRYVLLRRIDLRSTVPYDPADGMPTAMPVC